MVLFYSLEEAAAILGVSAAELRKKTLSGEIRAFLRGGIWRLRISEIHEIARRQGLLVHSPVEALPPSNPPELASPSPAPSNPRLSPPARIPASTPVAAEIPETTTVTNTSKFPKFIVSPPSLVGDTTPAASSRAESPVSKTGPTNLKRSASTEQKRDKDEKRPDSISIPNKTADHVTMPSSGTLASSPSAELSRPAFDSKRPNSPVEPVPPVPAHTDEANGVEDMMSQIEAFIEEVEESENQETTSSSASLANESSSIALKSPGKRGKAKLPDWEQLVESALSKDVLESEATPKGESIGDVDAKTSSPVAVELSPPDTARVVPTESCSERPAVARGHFPIQCPNPECRKYGQVPISILYDQLKCGSCDFPFFVNRYSNSVESGVRVVARPSWVRASSNPVTSRGPSRLEKAIDNWLKLSPNAKAMSLSKVAAAFLVCYLVYTFWPKVANNPNDRTIEIIAALDRNDVGRVRAIAVKDPSGAVDRWFKQIRAVVWPRTPMKTPPTVGVLYSRTSKKRAVASTVITLPIPEVSRPDAEDSATPKKKTMSKADSAEPALKSNQIRLLWVRESDEWLLDGRETLRISEAALPK
jgi:hypothetical protein